MTTYSTGNPLGSTDPKDLFDNAENFDNALNGGSDTWIDRLGNPRQSVKSFESRFLTALTNVGLDFIGDYAAGIQVTEYNQVIRSGGRFWRLSASENLPYTTTGTGMPEGGAFVDVGDAVLRQDLADGTALVSSSTGTQAVGEALDLRIQRTNIESFREPGFTDEQTWEAALASPVTNLYAENKTYTWSADAPEIPSDKDILGLGCIIIQNNFDPDATISVGDQYSGFRVAENAVNVKVRGFDIRGPWYQVDVTPTYRSIGIAVKGRYDHYYYDNPNYPANPPVRPTGESRNVRFIENKIDGFGQSGIIADQITGYASLDNEITNCGRDGERHYGVQWFGVRGNRIDKMAPGFPLEGLAPNFNVYGYSATRVYHCTDNDGTLTDYRPTKYGWIVENNISRCWTWKSLDTHGGTDLIYANNICVDSYIGLGVDKGGFTLGDGYAPPRRIKSIGNTYLNTADAPYQRAGIFAVAHDFTEENRGEDFKSIGDTVDGFGEDNRDGGIVVSFFKGVYLAGYDITNCLRAGINIQNTVKQLVIGQGTIRNVVESSLGACLGVSVQSGNVEGSIDGVSFSQANAETMTAVSIVPSATGFGVKLGNQCQFDGNVTKVNAPASLEACEYVTGIKAIANVNLSAGGASLSAGFGIKSVTRLSTGVVRIVLSDPATASNTIFTDVCAKGGAAKTYAANAVSANEIDITIGDGNAAPQDVGFVAKFSYY